MPGVSPRSVLLNQNTLITIGNWRKKLGAYFAPLRKSSLQRLPYRNRSRPRQLAPLRRKRLFLNASVSRSTSILCIRCCFRDRCARAAVSHLNWGRCARQHALPLSDPPKTKPTQPLCQLCSSCWNCHGPEPVFVTQQDLLVELQKDDE